MDLPAFNLDRRFLQLKAGRVSFFERGTGRAAVFLHGYPLSAFQWREVLPALAVHRRCIAPDMLAMGRTEAHSHLQIDAEAQLAMVVELMDRLGVEQADFVGSNSGGGIALLMAAQHPHRVRSLLLANCDTEICCPPPALQPLIDLARAGTLADEVFGRWWHDRALARSPDGMSGLVYSGSQHPTDEAIHDYFGPLVASAARRIELHQYTKSLDRNFLSGTRAKLALLPAPVRIVWGAGDRIFARESVAFLDMLFANSMGVRMLPGANLFWPEEQPQVLVEEALRLWSCAERSRAL